MNPATAPLEIEVRQLKKRFGDLAVLSGVDLQIRQHEVVALIGPSGSGKSTLLRCLNLLELPNDGEIFWGNQPVQYRRMSAAQMSRHRRRMGMVFQHFHLFPHRNVLANVIEGPVHVLGANPATARQQARELLDQVGLADKHDAWPSQLSGGQKQRVAIARALAMKPSVLLLDEITSALDVEMISGINDLLASIAERGMTMVVVTHDLSFARRLASQVHFLDQGRIVESGAPAQILDNPQSPRLREFLQTYATPPG